MLGQGRIPLSAEEHAAVDRLLEKHGATATITRRDPGDTGPVLLHVGGYSYQIGETGRTTKLKAA